jgi:hypothetical protein
MDAMLGHVRADQTGHPDHVKAGIGSLRSAPDGEGVIQACTNQKYKEFIGYIGKLSADDDPFFAEHSSAAFAEQSIKRDGAAAYIVNAILPYSDVARIPEVIRAMVNGLDGEDADRIAVVLGINAPADRLVALDSALRQAEALIEAFPIPIALVRSTFRGDFPYGTMRNEVLHSPETRGLTSYFRLSSYHPYVSFQDFDTASRHVGSEHGPHVFHAVDRVLSGVSDSDAMEGFENPIRPLMVAGGYRPGSQDRLIQDTLARFRRAPVPGVEEADIPRLLADFPDVIARDMRLRDEYARLDPLLPYAPEPNLFVDATAAALPSPQSGTRLLFGARGAEYTALAKSLERYAAEEVEGHYTTQWPGKDPQRVLASLLIDAQNTRHPRRGQSFYTDFLNMAVATDLSRLAHGYLAGTSPQSHAGLTTLVDRLFDSKDAKRGVSLAAVRNEVTASPDPRTYLESLTVRWRGVSTAERERFYQENQSRLGGAEGQPLSTALSVPFSSTGRFSGQHFGVPPQMAPFFTHQVAIHAPVQDVNARVFHDSVITEAQRIGVDRAFAIGHADGKDHNCTIISIFKAAGVDISTAEAIAYRQILIRDCHVPRDGDIELTRDVATRILQLVTERTRDTYQLNEVHEDARDDEADAPRHALTALAENGGRRPIYIFFAGNHFSPAWRR